MEKDPAQRAAPAAKPKPVQTTREDRLKAALKANMSRRKAQAVGKARAKACEAGNEEE
ncbi:hypothetical protein [uncultured Maritimibacter sp.]|jgi:hypothetical protein|uniref:hypothetical protein n=1 Tax=uncultured Maritimibacter sp. TaxID=991866 RepID=UPI000B028F8B|nr:hypothetical protein [uncultured Maritimibacter sp.]